MPNAWFQRLYLVLIAVLGSVYLLVPTFFWHPAEASTETPTLTATGGTSGTASINPLVAGSNAVAAAAATPEMPGWMGFFPKKRLHLGLDLVGGSHLGLGVDTEETLRAIASGHRRDVRDRLTKDGIPYVAVNQPLGTSNIEVVLKNAADEAEVTTDIEKHIDGRMEKQGQSADKDSNVVITYGFRRDAVAQIEDQAVTEVLELLRGRVNTFGVSEPIIFREKADRIVV